MKRLACCAVVALVSAATSCSDPVPDGEVAALGGEVGSTDEFHRAGQPCVLCHSQSGPASKVFSVAGTVFQSPQMAVGVDQAEVLMVDARNSSPPPGAVLTNRVGNFYVTPDVWDPAFPIFVGISKGGLRRSMQSHIGREPSCAFCHKDPVTAGEALSAVGHIYLTQ